MAICSLPKIRPWKSKTANCPSDTTFWTASRLARSSSDQTVASRSFGASSSPSAECRVPSSTAPSTKTCAATICSTSRNATIRSRIPRSLWISLCKDRIEVAGTARSTMSKLRSLPLRVTAPGFGVALRFAESVGFQLRLLLWCGCTARVFPPTVAREHSVWSEE
ncbi:hypothetical protein BKA80DRAFT_270695 [Phyllosticta citrichinensis]